MLWGRLAILTTLAAASGCEQLLGFQEVSVKQTPDAKAIPDAPPPPDAPAPVKITIELPGTGGGTVQSSPSGIDCPGTCEATFESGRKITLNQTFNGGSSFAGWGGVCADIAASCDINPVADTTIRVTFNDNSNGNNFVFVTSDLYPPNSFSPLSKADDLCNATAAKDKLPGHFVAWISSSTQAARDRFGTARGWVRPDGKPVVDRQIDLFSGRFYYPIDQTARGSEVPEHYWAATGTTEGGTAIIDRTCSDWTSTSASQQATIGMAGMAGNGFTEAGLATCNDRFRLFCFGVDRDKPITPPPAPTGRLAFVSNGSIPLPLGDISQVDAICQMEAQDAGLTGSYKALLSRVGKAAADRFNPDGKPWMRVDGVPLARPPSTLLNATRLIAPFNVTATKQYIGVWRIASGSATPEEPGFPSTTCNDWQSTDAAVKHHIGHAHQAFEWFSSFMPGCNEAPGQRLFCLEE